MKVLVRFKVLFLGIIFSITCTTNLFCNSVRIINATDSEVVITKIETCLYRHFEGGRSGGAFLMKGPEDTGGYTGTDYIGGKPRKWCKLRSEIIKLAPHTGMPIELRHEDRESIFMIEATRKGITQTYRPKEPIKEKNVYIMGPPNSSSFKIGRFIQ